MTPRIWICSICKDEAQCLPWFLRHYTPWVERIIVYDEASTDGTQAILSDCPKVDLRECPFTGLDDEKFMGIVNGWFQEARGQADWCAFVDIDELLWRPNILGFLSQAMADVIAACGIALISPSGWPADDGKSQIYDLVKTGVRQDNYDKKLLFRPSLNFQHCIGRHTMFDWPKHNGQEECGLTLFHLHHLGGVAGTIARNQRDYDHAVNKKLAWNYDTVHNGDPKQNGSVAWVKRMIDNNKLLQVIP